MTTIAPGTIEPYQIEPLARALRLPRVRMLLADEVGREALSAEAALVVEVLVLARRVRSALVVCCVASRCSWWSERLGDLGERANVVSIDAARGQAIWPPRPHDLLLVDDAHVVAPPGRPEDRESKRARTFRQLAPRFGHRVLVTPIPHNGSSASFARLLELLDGERFPRGTQPSASDIEAVMVRRLASDLRAVATPAGRSADSS